MQKKDLKNQIKHRSILGEAFYRLIRNKTAMLGFVILMIVVLSCVFANVICPEGYNAQNIRERNQSPSLQHPFGTDSLGRSMLARVLYGGRNSLLIGFLATCFSAAVGIFLGTICGFFGGNVDFIVMRILDVFNAIPSLLMAIVISACLGSGKGNTIIAIGIAFVPKFAQIIRGPVIAQMSNDYIEAARSIDAKNGRIMLRHILPNVLSPIIVQFTLNVALAILCVSSLSFIGLGIQPPEPEWGALLSSGRSYIQYYPSLIYLPRFGYRADGLFG